MENEEGMNHLWIRIFPDEASGIHKAEMDIQLPAGVYRSPNLNGYPEKEANRILLDLSTDLEVWIELYTQGETPCGEETIAVTLYSGDSEYVKVVRIRLVNVDDMDSVEIDEQVIKRLKELGIPHDIPHQKESEFVIIEPKVLDMGSNKYAYLEKKYRVDY
ncbi:hypothetical protein AB6A23_12795 [Paenibacillus tarimensis]